MTVSLQSVTAEDESAVADGTALLQRVQSPKKKKKSLDLHTHTHTCASVTVDSATA